MLTPIKKPLHVCGLCTYCTNVIGGPCVCARACAGNNAVAAAHQRQRQHRARTHTRTHMYAHPHPHTHAHPRTHTCAREEEADSSNKNCEITLKFWRPSAHFARVGAEAKIVKRRSVVVPLNPALPQHFLLRWPVLAFKETMHDHSKHDNLLLPRTNSS